MHGCGGSIEPLTKECSVDGTGRFEQHRINPKPTSKAQICGLAQISEALIPKPLNQERPMGFTVSSRVWGSGVQGLVFCT